MFMFYDKYLTLQIISGKTVYFWNQHQVTIISVIVKNIYFFVYNSDKRSMATWMTDKRKSTVDKLSNWLKLRQLLKNVSSYLTVLKSYSELFFENISHRLFLHLYCLYKHIFRWTKWQPELDWHAYLLHTSAKTFGFGTQRFTASTHCQIVKTFSICSKTTFSNFSTYSYLVGAKHLTMFHSMFAFWHKSFCIVLWSADDGF